MYGFFDQTIRNTFRVCISGFFIKAIKESLQEKAREQVYVVLSSICGGAIMLIVMGLLPNT